MPGRSAKTPSAKGLLYLGTEHGAYVSFDDGANWQSLQLNLPDTSVQGVQVADRDLVIATHGRSFWILDNIGVLRQATPTITTEALHVFDPVDPLRGLDRNVAIDYYLNADSDTVKIEFLDSSGAARAFVHRRRQGRRADARQRWRRRRWIWTAAGASRRQERHEPVHVGSAL